MLKLNTDSLAQWFTCSTSALVAWPCSEASQDANYHIEKKWVWSADRQLGLLLGAVGTDGCKHCACSVCLQVYNFTPAGSWQEDRGWVAQLDVGWKVEAVRDAAYAALAQVCLDWCLPLH